MGTRSVARRVLEGTDDRLVAEYLCPFCSKYHKTLFGAVSCVVSHDKVGRSMSSEQLQSVSEAMQRSYISGEPTHHKIIPIVLTDKRTGISTEVMNPKEFHRYLSISKPPVVGMAPGMAWHMMRGAVFGGILGSYGAIVFNTPHETWGNTHLEVYGVLILVGIYGSLLRHWEQEGNVLPVPLTGRNARVLFWLCYIAMMVSLVFQEFAGSKPV